MSVAPRRDAGGPGHRHRFERALTGRGYRRLAEIKVAELGEDAGIVGAADVAHQASQAAAP
jgi:hypothetical protein